MERGTLVETIVRGILDTACCDDIHPSLARMIAENVVDEINEKMMRDKSVKEVKLCSSEKSR